MPDRIEGGMLVDLSNLVRRQLRIHLVTDETAERIALAIAAAIEEHRPVELLESATVLRLQPGDTVVVTHKRRINDAELDYCESVLKPLFPDNQLLVLDGGADLTITRPE